MDPKNIFTTFALHSYKLFEKKWTRWSKHSQSA